MEDKFDRICANELIDVTPGNTNRHFHYEVHDSSFCPASLCIIFCDKSQNISENPTPENMKILIVGAGLGGLAAACCFARDGHIVQGSRLPVEI